MSNRELRTASGELRAVLEGEIEALQARLRGRLVRPSDADYDEIRLVWTA